MKKFPSPFSFKSRYIEENEKWTDEEQLMSFDRVEFDRMVNKG